MASSPRWLLLALALGAGCAHVAPLNPESTWACMVTTHDGQPTEACWWTRGECLRVQEEQRRLRTDVKATYGECLSVPQVWCFQPPAAGAALECRSSEVACEHDRNGRGSACQARRGSPGDAADAADSGADGTPKYACFTFQIGKASQIECALGGLCSNTRTQRAGQEGVTDVSPCAPSATMWCFVSATEPGKPTTKYCASDGAACAQARNRQGLEAQPGTECVEMK